MRLSGPECILRWLDELDCSVFALRWLWRRRGLWLGGLIILVAGVSLLVTNAS